jgi:class 3 adenylate cyclase/tetratricopeptide (TPR) repeat protein
LSSDRPGTEGERKQVTVLFADVAGFTSMSEELDPEEVHDLMEPCIDIMTEEVHRYGGTVAQFMGDGVMALFGAPKAMEDAPARALRSALATQERLSEYSRELSPGDIDLEARIGLNTGLVVVGSMGSDQAVEFTAVGDTVNLASRIESTTEPGTVRVTESTYHLTEAYFDFEDLGEVEVKGKKKPVRAYRVLKPKEARTRVEAFLHKGLSTFVGREMELDLLAHAYSRVKENHGQVVGILGEPGVGKSRLILEFLASLPEEEYSYLEGSCLHYGEAIAYLPILDILRHYFDIHEAEDQRVIKEKMEEKISALKGDLKSLLPPLHEVLSLSVEDESYATLEPQTRRRMVFEAISNLLITVSREKPLILVVEDLHWVDKTSEELLTYLIDGLAAASVFLILIYRPEYTSPWTSKSFYSQIRVDQLPRKTSEKLIEAMLSEGVVEEQITELIVGKASGNPLFIEELTQGLVENGSIIKDEQNYALSSDLEETQIPDTIQGIITARLDRLDETLKRIMQVASVIGREFAYRLLQAITAMREELKSSLHNLQSLEFIYEKSLFPELEYIFKHALTQEVAYNSLLLKRRKELHGMIGQAIEQLYSERLEEFYEMLAYHYAASENADKALSYLKLSGNKATMNYSSWEALTFYKEALAMLDTLPETGERKEEKLKICLAAQDPLILLNYPEGGLEILLEAERLAEELEDEKSLASVYPKCARYYAAMGDIHRGMEYSKKCIDAAEKMGDVDSMAEAAVEICNPLFHAGDILGLASTCRRALELLEEQHKEKSHLMGGTGTTTYAWLSAFAGLAFGCLGQFEDAKVFFQKGLKISRETDDALGASFVECMQCIPSFWTGDVDDVIEHARKSIERCEETGITMFLGLAWSYLGFGLYFLGDYEKAEEYAEKGVKLQSESGLPMLMPWVNYLLSLVLLDSGDLNRAKAHAEEALRLSQKFETKHYDGFAWMALGRVIGEADQAQIDVAEQYIRKGISIIEEMKCRPFSAHGHLLLGELFEKVGRREEAIENLKKSEAVGQDLGMGYWLTRTQEALARLNPAS